MTELQFDSITTAVIANKIDGVVREMTNTLLRSARSAVINSARDFSCALTTGSSELLACAEGLPVHIFGAQLQAAAMADAHPDLREGDAYLDNNPYIGCSHAADHTILVPVFVEDEHLFTAVVKAHQADIGNSIPTTYHAAAADVYEEGALIFPTVKVQSDYRDIDDIVRMCQARIRVPSQWYGDYLGMVGAARIAERRLKETVAKYGIAAIKQFIGDWFDYSEKRMRRAIEDLPETRLENSGAHDAFEPYLPEGLPFSVSISVQPAEGKIEVDLTNNGPNVGCGLNLTEATTRAAVIAGIFNAIPVQIPKNAGAFRRISIAMNEGSAVGKPRFPHSCSLATTNVADRLINCVGAAFAQLGSPYGVAEGAMGLGPGFAVVSGTDRRNGRPFVNQLVIGVNGGPASALADGWVTYGMPVVSGLMYRDSIEIDEIKMPLRYTHLRAVPDSGGAGEHRGGPAYDVGFTPVGGPITVIYPSDGHVTPPAGAAGGADGQRASAWLVDTDGTRSQLPNTANMRLEPGQTIVGIECSGGGYGDPVARDPESVLADVVEGWETTSHAEEVYSVVLVSDGDELVVDTVATEHRRRRLLGADPSSIQNSPPRKGERP